MLNNEIITSVLARATVEPNFLELLATDPAKVLKKYQGQTSAYNELHSFDFKKLYQFSGFITKVKNNNTWQCFQNTRKMLLLFKLELPFFIHYFPHFVRFKSMRLAVDNETRLDHFYDHVTKFLSDRKGKPSLLCQSILDHEHAIRSIKRNVSQSEQEPQIAQSKPKISLDSTFTLSPSVLLRKSKFNVLDLVSHIDCPTELLKMSPNGLWLLYQFIDGKLYVRIQDSYVALIITLINGVRSVQNIREILHGSLGKGVSNKEFLEFFAHLASNNIVRLN